MGWSMRRQGFFAIPIVVTALGCTAGCGLMPTSGPAVEDVQAAGTTHPVSLPYALVKLNTSNRPNSCCQHSNFRLDIFGSANAG